MNWKQLVAFADARGVTFVPELETPRTQRRPPRQPAGNLLRLPKDNSGKMVGKSCDEHRLGPSLSRRSTRSWARSCDVFKSSRHYFHVGCDESNLDIQDTPRVQGAGQAAPPARAAPFVGIRLSSSKNGQTLEEAPQADDRLARSAVGSDLLAQGRDLHALGRRRLFQRRDASAAATRSINPPWGDQEPVTLRSVRRQRRQIRSRQ